MTISRLVSATKNRYFRQEVRNPGTPPAVFVVNKTRLLLTRLQDASRTCVATKTVILSQIRNFS